MENLKQKSFKAFAWDFIGRIAGQTVGFIISIVLARLLVPEDFGLLAMVTVVIGLSSSLVDMGLGTALIQRKDVTDAHYGSVFFFNIAIGLLLTTALFFAAPWIGTFYGNDLLIPIAQAMSILFLANSIGNVIRVKLRRELDYGVPTQAGLIAAGFSGIIGIIMALNDFGVWSLVIQSLLNPIFTNIYLFYRVSWRPKFIFKWNALKDLWGFGFRMFLSGMLDSIFNNADSLIIGKLFPPATLGHYFRARSLNHYVVQYSSGSIMNVLFPAFSRVQDDDVKFKSLVYKGYHLISFLTFFLTGFFFVTGADIILLLFGPKWQPAIPLFQLIILTAWVYPLSSILVNVLSASGNSKAFLKLEVIKKVFFGLSLAIGFIWGIEGYLICNLFAYVLAVYANIIFAGEQLKTGQWWFLKMTIPYLLITIFISTVLFWIQSSLEFNKLYHLLLGGGLFSLIYFGISWVIKVEGLFILFDQLMGVKKIQKTVNTIKSKFFIKLV